MTPFAPDRLGRGLVLDELFDLSLYRGLRAHAGADLRRVLDELIPIESEHFAFWQRFFGMEVRRLDPGRRLKLALVTLACRLFGDRAIDLVLEAIEVHGVRKYLTVWALYRETPLGQAVRQVLDDELRHEDRVVSAGGERRIAPELVRNLFLGFNDGLVEILGAVSGFFAAFADTASVLVASCTVAVAGACSMAASAFGGASSEREMARLQADKHEFLDGSAAAAPPPSTALRVAVFVGISYLLGATIPVLPVLLGARTIVAPLVAGGFATVIVSTILAFLSGMRIRQRLATNLVLLALAVAVTYAIGLLAKAAFGIAVP